MKAYVSVYFLVGSSLGLLPFPRFPLTKRLLCRDSILLSNDKGNTNNYQQQVDNYAETNWKLTHFAVSIIATGTIIEPCVIPSF